MSLRSRLIAAFVAVFVLLGVSSVVVTLVQRSYLMGQVDQQLTNLTPAAGAVISRLANNAARPSAQSALQSEFSEFYIGRVAPDGRMQTFVAPVSDPELVPELPTVPVYGTPLTVRTSGGSVNRVRIIETRLNDGSISISVFR